MKSTSKLKSSRKSSIGTIKKRIHLIPFHRDHAFLRSLESDMVEFYFHFPQEVDAFRFQALLATKGFYVSSFRRMDSLRKKEWELVVFRRILEDALFSICMQFDAYAKQYNGTYDGYER